MVIRTERQAHGFIFQDWIISKFLDMAYTAKWDIPKEINPLSNKSVSIKTAKYRGGVGLGDALTQFRINEDFQLLVAFYEESENIKKIVNVQLIDIPLIKWKEMWGNLTEEKLLELNNFIKSDEGRNINGAELDRFRANVQRKKNEILKDYTGKFSLNPKIDSKTQRRLQCSIGFNTLFETFGLNDEVMTYCELWGESVRLNSIPLS